MEPKECIVTNWDRAATMLYEGPRPIGLIIVSADVGLKNKFVYHTLEKVFASALCITSSLCKMERLRNLLKETDVVCVSLTPQDSCDHKKRHSIVTMLCQAGVEAIYAVYLPGPEMSFRDYIPYREANALRAKLLANPPNADGLDALIILENGEGEKEETEENKEEKTK